MEHHWGCSLSLDSLVVVVVAVVHDEGLATITLVKWPGTHPITDA